MNGFAQRLAVACDTGAKDILEMVYYIGLQCLLLKEIKKSGVIQQIIIWHYFMRTGDY